MRAFDGLGFAARALTGARTRSALMLLAMAIGVAAVVVLTALGEGARRYIVNEFEQLGSHLLIVLPGRSETTGGAPPLLGETPRDLTLGDALALTRARGVVRVAPITVGGAPVSHGRREREVTVLGTTADFFPIRGLGLQSGRPLPAGDPERAAPVAVLGARLAAELFDNARPLGRWVRIGDRRFRVVGVLADAGESLGHDLGDIALVPVASAQSLFNVASLFRVLVQVSGRDRVAPVRDQAREIIRARHDGEDDVTLIAQDALLRTFDEILRALTYTVGGIAAVSLAVAGILIMNVMLVAVSGRTAEIGLLKALGAPRRQILTLFLVESTLLAGVGAAAGLALGLAGVGLLRLVFPLFPVAAPLWAPLAAAAVALGAGLLFGLLPARRAAGLDPVLALAGR